MSQDSVTQCGGQRLGLPLPLPCPLTGLPHLFMDLLVHPHDSIL